MSVTTNANGHVISYGELTIDTATIPPASLAAFLRRGVAHYFGNELAAKVSTYKKGTEAKGTAGSEGYVPASVPTDEQVAEFRQAAFDRAHRAMVEGTMGEGRGPGEPKLSPLDAIVAELAWNDVQAVLTKSGMKAPRGDKTLGQANEKNSVKPTGAAADFTKAVLIERAIAKHADGYQAEAAKVLKARERETAKALDRAGSLDDLI